MDTTGNYGWWLPVQASSYAQTIDTGINVIQFAMLLMFVLWGIFFTWCLFRFRARTARRAVYKEPAHWKSWIPDGLVLAFEILLIALYGIPVWSRIMQTLPNEKDANVVRVVAEQFAWNVHYPGPDGQFGNTELSLISKSNRLGLDRTDPKGKDDIVLWNQMFLPLGKPTILHLTSKDVIHSFFVPAFRMKQDMVPGLVIQRWVEPTRVGKYEIGCAQLCGLGHYKMRGDVFVQTQEEFDRWLVEKSREQREEREE
ncbi:cytochrome-c oxidase [candidate division TA06 bacterium]|nr:cytochrome-c oxidase [candidate division TA06 bacterium]